jgi:hypothetical protein
MDVIVDPLAPVVYFTLDGRTVLDPMTNLGVIVVGGSATVGRDVTDARAPKFEGTGGGSGDFDSALRSGDELVKQSGSGLAADGQRQSAFESIGRSTSA